MERKLAAILCADVFGYSRLMGENEEATIRTLSAHRKIIDALIEQHRGRFVNSAGDSVLAEFASAVNAVECAVEIQTALKKENADVPVARRMEFRIGINLGDVVIEGEEIYGDGVNVAARLESLAEPGGIRISAKVLEEVGNKLPLGYDDLGEQAVKNITKPIRVFRVQLNGASGRTLERARIPRNYQRGAMFFLTGLLLIVATIVLVEHVSLKPPHTNASIPAPQRSALPLPDKPSIAVLPFINLSGDREQEYFSDGITDDLITGLSRFPELFVIARESTFTYKGKPAKLQDVSKELGVKYVLEGSVRKAAGQVRITVQLADATTGAELWAERYDRPLRDVFKLQDEIVRKIMTTLNLQLALSQQGEGVILPRSTENLEAYDDLLRGLEYFVGLTAEGNAKARAMFEKAIALDPKYAPAYALLGWNYWAGSVFGFSPDPNSGMERALQLEQTAITLDDSLPMAHTALAEIYASKGQYDQAITEAHRAIALDPNSASGYHVLSDVLNIQFKPEEALVAVDKGMRLNPRNTDYYLLDQGWAYSLLGRWKEAIVAFAFLTRYPDLILGHTLLASDYSALGKGEAARSETAQVESAIGRSPNSPVGYSMLALALNAQGRPAEALVAVKKAISLNPQPDPDLYIGQQGNAYLLLRRDEEATPAIKTYLARHPNDFWAHAWLGVGYMELGHDDYAREEVAEALRLDPQITVETVFPIDSLQHKASPTELDRFRADLHKAGMK